MQMAVGTVIIAVLWWVAALVGYIYYTSRSRGLSNVAPALPFYSFSRFFLGKIVLYTCLIENYTHLLQALNFHVCKIDMLVRSVLHNWRIKLIQNHFFSLFGVVFIEDLLRVKPI